MKFCIFKIIYQMDKDYVLCNFFKSKYYVNLMELREMCENGVLKDAKCFQFLFGFQTGPFKKNENIFDFSQFHITYNEWSNLLTFLKQGQPFLEKLEQNDLHDLTEICNKFGGIPFFDRSFSNILSSSKKTINVFRPQDDTGNLFLWKAVTDSNLQAFNNTHRYYSYSGHYDNITNLTRVFYYKKSRE